MWHACASVCKPKGLSLFHIRHKQRKRRDTRLIACRAQLPLRSCHWKPGSTADLSLTIMTHHHIARHTTPPTSIGYASKIQPPASALVLPALRTCVLKATKLFPNNQPEPKSRHQSRTRDLAAKFPVVLACVVVVSISSSANQLSVSKHTCCHPCICEAVGLCPDRVVRPFAPYIRSNNQSVNTDQTMINATSTNYHVFHRMLRGLESCSRNQV